MNQEPWWLKILNRWIKSADPAEELWDERKYRGLHSRIMAKLDQVDKETKIDKKKPRGRLWRGQSSRPQL